MILFGTPNRLQMCGKYLNVFEEYAEKYLSAYGKYAKRILPNYLYMPSDIKFSPSQQIFYQNQQNFRS
jgi:hypothetical protein